MDVVDPVETASYELPRTKPLPSGTTPMGKRSGRSLREPLLIENVLWFCRLRWIFITVLLGFGVLGKYEGAIRYLGLHSPGDWPFVVAGVLTLTNVLYLIHGRSLVRRSKRNGTRANLWSQIILDLMILTVVVHFLGSLRTYVSFTYLFHIVLACVFFSRIRSFAVVVVSSILFSACVAAEHFGMIAPIEIFIDGTFRYRTLPAGELVLNSLSVTAIWLVVWYLASRLSEMVRRRDSELAETNRRLVAAQEERSRHMLTTTHQLKAPFAAIHANTQLLLKGHCGVLPDAAGEVVQRIAARSSRLAGEIQEMLQLANLSSTSQHPPQQVELDVSEVLRWCVEQVRALARERGIALDVDIQPAQVRIAEDHLKMLFGNLLSNAVNYSHEGGRIRIQCFRQEDSQLLVSIADEGIGIPPEKLPRIFDEHYRTNEAVRHNKESSGLGLAIVRHVAQLHGIHLRVESQPGKGTIFELRFLPVEDNLRIDKSA